MNKSIEDIKRDLKRYNQEHLWDFYEKLEGKNKEKFLQQLEKIDYSLIDNLYQNTTKEVLKQDKLLTRLGLDIPFMVKLSIKLKYYGLLKDIELIPTKMVDEVWK